MSKIKSRTSGAELALFALVFIGLILTVVGLFVNFITTKAVVAGQTVGEGATSTLFSGTDDLFGKFNGDTFGSIAKDSIHGFQALQAFGIITVIGVAATLVMSLLKVLTDWKLMRIVTVLVGVCTLAAAIVTLILIYTYVPVDLGDLGKLTDVGFSSAPAVGGWLLTIGGIAGGASGLFCAFAK